MSRWNRLCCTFEPKSNPMDAHAGRRKLSGDRPTILMRNGRPWVALGTPGGHTIGQTVPQMVINLVDFGLDVGGALAAPRISVGEPDVIAVEEAIPEEVQRGLESKGHKLRIVRGIGNAHALSIEYDAQGRVQRFLGAADPRGAGLANRIGNAKKANVRNVIHALGGLFVLNLWLREADVTQRSEHFNLAQARISAYSRFCSPAQFLTLDSQDGLSGPMSGGNLRSLVFDWN
jgi:Gamma-glutamyltranspeptidase